MRRVRSRDIRFQNDFCGACGFAVELAICIFVGPERRAIERYARKNTSRAGVAQKLRTHVSIRISRSRTSLRSSGDRCVRSQLHLGAQQAASATVVHHEKNEIGGFSTNLQTNAAAFQRIHGRCAPRTGEVLTGATYHRAATVAAANDNAAFNTDGITTTQRALSIRSPVIVSAALVRGRCSRQGARNLSTLAVLAHLDA